MWESAYLTQKEALVVCRKRASAIPRKYNPDGSVNMDLFESMLDRVVVNDPTPAMQHFAATVIAKLVSQTCKQGSLLRTNGPPLQFKLIGPQRERESRHDRNDYWRQWLTASRLATQVKRL